MLDANSASSDEGAGTALFDDALQRANAGRKLVIYERETGLFAYWYIALRCEEECYRALRYQRPLSIAIVEPDHASDTWAVAEQITGALEQRLRNVDLPGYLGNARYIIVMPETGQGDALGVLERIEEDVAGIQWGLAAYPRDGANFDQLYEVAARRLEFGDGAQTAPPTIFQRDEQSQPSQIDGQDADFLT